MSSLEVIFLQTLVPKLESLKGTSTADAKEAKFLTEDLQTAKASLESYFKAEDQHEGLEKSHILTALTHLTDVYL